MMRNDNIKFWNSAEQFLLGGIAPELAVIVPPEGAGASPHDTTTVSSLITLTGTSKGND
jgi:hypothetical protein